LCGQIGHADAGLCFPDLAFAAAAGGVFFFPQFAAN
jgi:hypothetical protein